MATKLDREFVGGVRVSGAYEDGFEALVHEVERLEELLEMKEQIINDLMAAYHKAIATLT